MAKVTPAVFGSIFLCALAACPSSARADPPTSGPKAQNLFELAKRHMDDGNFAAACAELSESENLDPQVGTALNVAYCYERLGRTATAWSMWLQAAAAAAARGQRERQRVAAERATRLQALLLHVIVTVAPQAAREQLRLTIDRAPVPRNEWGLPIALDPGKHELFATADGFRPWSNDFVVGDGMEPSLVVPELEPVTPPMDKTSARGRGSAPAAVVVATGAAGVAVLGLGAAFGIASLVNANSANANQNCAASGCNATGYADRTRSHDDALVADVLFATGGAAVLVSGVMYFVSRSTRNAVGLSWATHLSVPPNQGATLLLEGAW